jgi:hypothetical protein
VPPVSVPGRGSQLLGTWCHIETRYANSGGINIACQVVGRGPINTVFVMGWVSNIECFWDEPHFARFLRRLASFSQLTF